MPRTTLNLDPEVLEALRRRGAHAGRSLGAVASELLAQSLDRDAANAAEPRELAWHAKPMGARVDIDDNEAVMRAIEPR